MPTKYNKPMLKAAGIKKIIRIAAEGRPNLWASPPQSPKRILSSELQ